MEKALRGLRVEPEYNPLPMSPPRYAAAGCLSTKLVATVVDDSLLSSVVARMVSVGLLYVYYSTAELHGSAAAYIAHNTVILALRAHRIQGILRENQAVLILIYTVYDPAHMVQTFGHTPNSMCL